MGHLNKAQYDNRRESAAKRNIDNENIAISNGMTAEQASAITKLCSARHNYHSNLDDVVKGENSSDIIKALREAEDDINETGLNPLYVIERLEEIDDMNGLIYEYGDDVPQDHDSQEYQDWYDDNYQRIYEELEELNKDIETYLSDIDKKYKTSWCPSGVLRML